MAGDEGYQSVGIRSTAEPLQNTRQDEIQRGKHLNLTASPDQNV